VLADGIRPDQPPEEVVERADLPAHQRPALGQEFTLDAVDVRPVRHDQKRLVLKRGQVALQEEGDFARVCGPGQERQGHRPILDSRPDGLFRAFSLRAKS